MALHAAIEVKPLCLAIERLLIAAVPPCLVGMAIMRLPWNPAAFYSTRDGFGDPLAAVRNDPAVNMVIPSLIARPGRKFDSPHNYFKTDAEYMRSPMYQQVAKMEGWHHAYSMLFWRGSHMVGYVGTVRAREQGNFTRAETATIRKLRPQVETALRRVLKVDRLQIARSAVESFLVRTPQPVLVLDWELRVAYRNRAAEDFCARWNFGSRAASLSNTDVFEAPVAALEACRALRKGIEARLLHLPPAPPAGADPLAPIRHPEHHGLHITVKPMELRAARMGLPSFLVEMHEESPNGTAQLDPDATRSLTRREREIVVLLVEGSTNRQIAARLGRSLGTVKKHLTSIFYKLAVPNRSTLVRLLAR